jgi:hypothetical protein
MCGFGPSNRLERELDQRELVAADLHQRLAIVAPQPVPLARAQQHRVRPRQPTVPRRIERIPDLGRDRSLVAACSQQFGEAAVGCVEVEIARGRRAVETMDEPGRRAEGRAPRCANPLGRDGELELALDDEERIGMTPVDVRARTGLSASVPRVGGTQLLQVDRDRDRSVLPRGDRFAFLRPTHDSIHRLRV